MVEAFGEEAVKIFGTALVDDEDEALLVAVEAEVKEVLVWPVLRLLREFIVLG